MVYMYLEWGILGALLKSSQLRLLWAHICNVVHKEYQLPALSMSVPVSTDVENTGAQCQALCGPCSNLHTNTALMNGPIDTQGHCNSLLVV